jgi:hypothetical protein
LHELRLKALTTVRKHTKPETDHPKGKKGEMACALRNEEWYFALWDRLEEMGSSKHTKMGLTRQPMGDGERLLVCDVLHIESRKRSIGNRWTQSLNKSLVKPRQIVQGGCMG